jgi:hypothetical protein
VVRPVLVDDPEALTSLKTIWDTTTGVAALVVGLFVVSEVGM